MSDMEKAMESMIVTFHRYASDDKDGKTLNKKELKKFLENEMPFFLKTQTDPNFLDRIIKDLDENKDDKLDFQEFMGLVAGISINCEKIYSPSKMKGKN